MIRSFLVSYRLRTAVLAAATVALGSLLVENAASAAPEGGGKGGKGGKGKGGKGKGKGKKDKPDGMGPFAKDDYPMSEKARPLVLPDAMGEIGVDAAYTRIGVPLIDDVNAFGIGAGFAYGIADMVEVGVSSSIFLAPDVDWSKQISLRANVLAYDSKAFDFAPGLIIPFDFNDGAPFGATVDLTSRYVISEKFFTTFGHGALPIGVSPDFSLALVANGTINYQINKQAYVGLGLNPLTIGLAPDVQGTGIWDYLSANLVGQYTPTRQWDVGLNLTYFTPWDGGGLYIFGGDLYGRFRF